MPRINVEAFSLRQIVDAINKMFIELYASVGGGGGSVTQVNTALPITGGPFNIIGTIGVNNFTAGASGVVPGSGGGVVNFLRADGSWVAPVGGTVNSVTAGDGLAASPNPIVGAGTISLQNRFADSLLLMGA